MGMSLTSGWICHTMGGHSVFSSSDSMGQMLVLMADPQAYLAREQLLASPWLLCLGPGILHVPTSFCVKTDINHLFIIHLYKCDMYSLNSLLNLSFYPTTIPLYLATNYVPVLQSQLFQEKGRVQNNSEDGADGRVCNRAFLMLPCLIQSGPNFISCYLAACVTFSKDSGSSQRAPTMTPGKEREALYGNVAIFTCMCLVYFVGKLGRNAHDHPILG